MVVWQISTVRCQNLQINGRSCMQRKSSLGPRPVSRRPTLNVDSERTNHLIKKSEEIREELQTASGLGAGSPEMPGTEDPPPNPLPDSQKSIFARPQPKRTSSGRNIFDDMGTVDDLVREAEEKKQREEAERKAKEEAERRQREKEEAERRQREEIERKAREKEEAERRQREEAQRKAKEEAERRQREKEDSEKRQSEEIERKAREKEESERRQREETEKRAREKEERERRQREEAERKERERRQAERREKERRDEERRRQREEERKREEEKRKENRPMAFFVDSSFDCSALPEKSAEEHERECERWRAEESEIKAQYLSRLKSPGQAANSMPSWNSSFRNSDAYKAQFVSYPIQL